MPLTVFGGMLVAGILIGVVAVVGIRAMGARPNLARRLAGPPEIKVGRLLGDEPLPSRAVRVAGRVRCREPLVTADGEQLVAFHRDVEVRIGGRWRSLERTRESRSFELWDHDGSLTVDPADAAEPLVTIPKVWRGSPELLEEPHASAMRRLVERHGAASEARATTRTLSVIDRLLVLARADDADGGRPRLVPPKGGFVISNLELPDAMRILAGRHRLATVAAVGGLAMGIALMAIGGIGFMLSAILTA